VLATVDTLSIDNTHSLPVTRPTSVAEVGELVRNARAAKQGIYPVGGRTTLDVGLPPSKPGIALDTTALNQVIDYPARDMTITVQAGITLAALQATLAHEGQWLPIDVAAPERATLGGAIALNQSGPRRYGYGTLRDYVIGISFVTDEGVEVKAGGRVVKNVAGYDLMKLQIGAVGTLGIITQVTLKVKPKPEAAAAMAFSCSRDSVGVVLDVLHNSKSRPIAVELLNGDAWRAAGASKPFTEDWIVVVGFEEKAGTVAWQLSCLQAELQGTPAQGVITVGDPAALLAAITELQLRAESRFISKASVLPSQVATQLSTLPPGLVHAHALSGVIWTHGDAPLAGCTIRRCPPEAKKSLAVWGTPPTAWELMRHVKSTLDPDNVFNPGRLFGDV
jgi:glycolate oxidase FAD binding subunit